MNTQGTHPCDHTEETYIFEAILVCKWCTKAENTPKTWQHTGWSHYHTHTHYHTLLELYSTHPPHTEYDDTLIYSN